jgi:hypothetical protein
VRRWLLNALLVLVAIGVGLGLSEVGVRLVAPQRLGVWHEDRAGLALHWPGLVTYLPQFGQTVSINSMGMRDHEHPRQKPDGVFRVLVLGDSFMEALQVPFEASFPSLLQHGLEQGTGRRIEVINASVSGWGTDDELKYLISYGAAWKADVILVAMTLHNDISDNLRQRFHTLRNGALVEQARPEQSRLAYGIVQLKGFGAAHSHLYQLVIRFRRAAEKRAEAAHLSSHVVELFEEQPDGNIRRGVELTARLLERIQAVAAAGGGKMVIMLLPLAVQLSPQEFAQFARARAAAAHPLTLDQPQRLMRAVGEQIKVPVIDLLPEFGRWTSAGGGPLYLAQDGHWNEGGHRLAASIAARELVEQHLVR